MPLYPLQD